MRKIIFNLALALALVLMTSFVFADSTLQWATQPNSLYNLGDVVSTSAVVSGTSFSASLICNSAVQNTQFPTFNNLLLTNLTIPIQFRITPDIAGGATGACQIKALLDGTNFYTTPFQISNVVNVTVTSPEREFQPGNQISLSGTAIKQNGQNIEGLSNINITFGNNTIFQGSAPVDNGNFFFNFTLPPDAAAGQYLVNIISSETDSSQQILNTGYTTFNILVDQVPTTLNIVPETNNQNVMPGGTYSFRSILYDQSGQKINANVNFTIINSKGEIMDQEKTGTDTVLNVPISTNDIPDGWSVSASSMGLNAQSGFFVLRNAVVSASLTNRTLLVTNIGNVPYNHQILVELGNQSVPFNVSLGVGQSQKYILSAPNGNYTVAVLSPDGNSLYQGDVSLTGNAVYVQQATVGVLSFFQYPLVWIAIILILVFVIFFLFRRSHKKRFSKKIDLNKTFRLRDGIIVDRDNSFSRNRMINSRNTADFSTSIQGEKQSSTIVAVNIKNFEEVHGGKGGINETMNRLKYIADESRAVVYENGTYFFFIFAPIKTKTLNNELEAIDCAQQIKRVLDDHNRLLKQKIIFGISVNYGMIIARQGINGVKFMSLGNLISIAKRLASLSKGEIVLSREVRNRVATDVKTEKQTNGDLEYFPLIEVRNREKSQRFIKEFMTKMEREEQESNKKFFN
jgi:hypothetical protein